jgi:hypothetical protein
MQLNGKKIYRQCIEIDFTVDQTKPFLVHFLAYSTKKFTKNTSFLEYFISDRAVQSQNDSSYAHFINLF